MPDTRDCLKNSDILELMDFADTLIKRSRSIVLSNTLVDSDIRNKSVAGDPVTNIDMQIEKEWTESIRSRFPTHSIVGEELGTDVNDSDMTWVLDPIDGTDDLIRGGPLFGSIIAVLYKGDPIVGVIDHPKLDLCCQAMYGSEVLVNGAGIGRTRSSNRNLGEAVVVPAYDDLRKLDNCDEIITAIGLEAPNQRIYRNVYGHTMVATGKFAAGFEVDVAIWDLAATRLLIEKSDGKFVVFRDTGGHWTERRFGAIFGSAAMVDRLETILNQLT